MRGAVAMIVGGVMAGMLLGALAPERDASGDKRYEFLPARQHLWVIDKERGEVVFFKFPDTETRPIQRSKTYVVDRKRFPREETQFILSTRELSSVLWIVNEASGEVEVVRYTKDGAFDAEFRLSVSRQFE
jgi:6-phosphogluconolactonase (cycloisomerase 2 family)